jgi:hypothetical protein
VRILNLDSLITLRDLSSIYAICSCLIVLGVLKSTPDVFGKFLEPRVSEMVFSVLTLRKIRRI